MDVFVDCSSVNRLERMRRSEGDVLDQETPIVGTAPGACGVFMDLIDDSKGHVGKTDECIEHHAHNISVAVSSEDKKQENTQCQFSWDISNDSVHFAFLNKDDTIEGGGGGVVCT